MSLFSSRRSRRHSRGPQRHAMRPAVAAVTVLCLVLASCAWLVAKANARFSEVPPKTTPTYTNPFNGTTLYAYSGSQAVQAFQQAPTDQKSRLALLATTPTAIWLTPERYPSAIIGSFLNTVLSDAQSKHQTAVFVVYGFPNRDCGSYSASGITADEYMEWLRRITYTLRRSNATPILILEPDALALSTQCEAIASNIPLLKGGVDLLTTSGASIYIDAGHSGWVPAPKMAALLQQVGLGKVRGFSLNVSNYDDDTTVRAYGEAISRLTGSHYVIDSGRNGRGHGGAPSSAWCNPSGVRVGTMPGVSQYGSQDAFMWIKPPGESDGTCNSGPPAGTWWNQRALELTST